MQRAKSKATLNQPNEFIIHIKKGREERRMKKMICKYALQDRKRFYNLYLYFIMAKGQHTIIQYKKFINHDKERETFKTQQGIVKSKY